MSDNMKSLESTIRSELEAVEEQLKGYDELVERRKRLQAMLDIASGAVSVASARAPSRAAPQRRRGRVSGDEVKAGLLERIRQEPGYSGKHYADPLGMNSNTAGKYLSQLVEEGQIRKIGERRTTKYEPA